MDDTSFCDSTFEAIIYRIWDRFSNWFFIWICWIWSFVSENLCPYFSLWRIVVVISPEKEKIILRILSQRSARVDLRNRIGYLETAECGSPSKNAKDIYARGYMFVYNFMLSSSFRSHYVDGFLNSPVRKFSIWHCWLQKIEIALLIWCFPSFLHFLCVGCGPLLVPVFSNYWWEFWTLPFAILTMILNQ